MSTIDNRLNISDDKIESVIGHEDIIDLFFKTISEKNKSYPAVLVYYGDKGIGKTTLCKELCDRLEDESGILWSSFDFKIPLEKELDGFLFSLRNQFNKKYDVVFPSFDIAYAYLWQKSYPHLSLKKDISAFTDGKSPVSNILRTLDELPSKGFIPTISRIFAIPGNRFNKWWKTKGIRELANIPLLDQKDIIEKLPIFWADDFNNFIKNSKEKILIFLDSYDSYLNNEVLQKWILLLDKVIFVIFSTNELQWFEKNEKWKNTLKSIHLKRFPEENAKKYLMDLGIDDENIRSFMVKESNGLPYLLNFEADMYNEIKERKNRRPKISDFKDIHINKTEILHSILDEYEIETLKILSFSEAWDKELLFSLITKFNTGFPKDEIGKLSRFTFVRETEVPGFWTIKEWIKKDFQLKVEKNKQKEIYKFLFAFYNEKIKSINFNNISDFDKRLLYTVFHYAKNTFELYDFANWFLSLCKNFKEAGQYKFLLPLIDKLMSMLLKIKNDDSKEFVNILISIGTHYKNSGKLKEAEVTFRKAIDILENISGKESIDLAECMINLADVITSQGNFSEAEPLYIKSIVLLNPLNHTDRIFSTATLINVAVLYAKQGKYNEAVSLFEKTLSIRIKTHGKGHPEVSKIYTNIANIEFDRKNYGEAETLYRMILGCEKEYYGENHPEVSKAMVNLGNVLIEVNKYEEATLLFDRAKDIFKEFYGNEHPDYAMTLNNLAYLNYVTGNYSISEIFYLEALGIYKNILGTEHPDIATLYTNLGNLYTRMKKYNEAKEYLKDSLEIKSHKLGIEHSETSKTYLGFAELYEAIGNYKQALINFEKYEKILLKQTQHDNQELIQIKEKISVLRNK